MGWNDIETTTSAVESEKTPYTKFNAGNNLIRILDEEPFSFWSHWLNKQQTSVTCMGKGCPICNIVAQMKANKETPIYGNSKRHAIRIWNYETNQMEVMIQGKNFFSQLLVFHKEVGDLTGYDIKVVKKGDGKDTTYTLLPTAPKDFAHMDKVTEVDIPNLLRPPTQEEMLMLIEGKTWSEINGTDESVA